MDWLNSKAFKWGRETILQCYFDFCLFQSEKTWFFLFNLFLTSNCAQRRYISLVGTLFCKSTENFSGPKSNIQVKQLSRSFNNDYRDDIREKGLLARFVCRTGSLYQVDRFIYIHIKRTSTGTAMFIEKFKRGAHEHVCCLQSRCMFSSPGWSGKYEHTKNFQPTRLAGIPASQYRDLN